MRLEQFPEELIGSSLITTTLHQDINHLAMLTNSSLQIVFLAFYFDDNFIKMPFVRRLGATSANLVGIGLSEFPTPLSNHFIGDLNAPIHHHFLDISEAQGEGVV